MMCSRSLLTTCIALATVGIAAALPANAQLLGPTQYFEFDDSPFFGVAIAPGGYFFLEDVEDNLFNTPGASTTAIVTSTGFTLSSIVDSVDADDGAINGTNGNAGEFGDSLFSNNGAITITFNPGTLGTLPTHAGLVWTDGSGGIEFEAFDALGLSLGTTAGNHADENFGGGTAEDRFYGAINAGGISSIVIRNGGAGIEADHIQYGTLQTATVPEAGTLSLIGGAFGVCAGVFVVRRRKTA